MTGPDQQPQPRCVAPAWPDEPFNLLALDAEFEVGPFTKGGFDVGEDGTLYFSDGYSHPVTLRVRRQEGEVIYANDGHEPMRYRIVPLSFYENRHR